MRTSSNILFLTLILSLVLSSCVKEPGDFRPSLNIVSLINPENALEVFLSKTAPALGSHENLGINNADIVIINNETREEIRLLNSDNGIYTSKGVKPLPGYDYEIQVRADGFEDAFATTYIPDLGDVAVSPLGDQNGKEQLKLTFSANLQSTSTSSFFAYELIYSGEQDEISEQIPLEEQNEVVKDSRYVNSLLPIVGAISDGSTTEIIGPNTLNPRGELAKVENVSVRIVAVSAQYYDYLMLEKNPETTHYSSVYYDENKVFSNYIGGAYGIFGGYNDKIIKLTE